MKSIELQDYLYDGNDDNGTQYLIDRLISYINNLACRYDDEYIIESAASILDDHNIVYVIEDYDI